MPRYSGGGRQLCGIGRGYLLTARLRDVADNGLTTNVHRNLQRLLLTTRLILSKCVKRVADARASLVKAAAVLSCSMMPSERCSAGLRGLNSSRGMLTARAPLVGTRPASGSLYWLR